MTQFSVLLMFGLIGAIGTAVAIGGTRQSVRVAALLTLTGVVASLIASPGKDSLLLALAGALVLIGPLVAAYRIAGALLRKGRYYREQ